MNATSRRDENFGIRGRLGFPTAHVREPTILTVHASKRTGKRKVVSSTFSVPSQRPADSGSAPRRWIQRRVLTGYVLPDIATSAFARFAMGLQGHRFDVVVTVGSRVDRQRGAPNMSDVTENGLL
jgi:hypothetical protein